MDDNGFFRVILSDFFSLCDMVKNGTEESSLSLSLPLWDDFLPAAEAGFETDLGTKEVVVLPTEKCQL